jgi:hypothetical protein
MEEREKSNGIGLKRTQHSEFPEDLDAFSQAVAIQVRKQTGANQRRIP